MLPLHEISATLVPEMSKVLIKVHILTGEDVMSKVGTKHAAYSMDPLRHLINFGENSSLSSEEITQAEEYLVRVHAGVRSKPMSKTFDGLILEAYANVNKGIIDLPPTSHSINALIYRGTF